MKKVLLAVAAIAMLAIGASSCSKEKDCNCKATVGGISIDLGTYHITEGNCSDLETTLGGYEVITCTRV